MAEETWRDALPDDLKVDPNVAKFSTPAELAKSYVEVSKMIGSSIRPPGPDAGPEARKEFLEKLQKAAPELVYAPAEADEAVTAQFWKRLGKPEKVEEYEADKEVADAIDLNEARNIAQITGLTKGQFKALTKAMADAKGLQAAEVSKAKDALKAEWGVAYGERVAAAATAAAKLGMSDAQVKAIVSGEVPPDQLRFLHTVAAAVGANPRELSTTQGGASGAMTPADAQMAISEIMNNRTHPYWNPRDPANGAAIQKMLKLVEMSNPKLTSRTG